MLATGSLIPNVNFTNELTKFRFCLVGVIVGLPTKNKTENKTAQLK